MANGTSKVVNCESQHITNSASNLLNSNVTSLAGPVGMTMTQPFLVVTHIRVVNTSGSPVTVSLFKGATGASAAGTEFAFSAVSIPANSYVDWYGTARFDAVDFLTGLASTTNVLTLNVDAGIGLT